jgi:cytochrome P450
VKAPKPEGRPRKVSLWQFAKLFRRDILSALPDHLFKAKMAEFRTPFFQSFLVNDPALIDLVLKDRPMDFPKSGRVAEGLRPLLGDSVFLTNGETWLRQRRIIDPAFEGGRLRDTFDAMLAAGLAACARLQPGAQDIEPETSHAAADVIFRTLFSIPITADIATRTFEAFRAYQRAQPILNPAALIPLPKWMPRLFRRGVRSHAQIIRALITELVQARAVEIAEGRSPDDLATKIMTTKDPVTGQTFTPAEMVDQVAIFFLAGHETSASALAWALYLLATHPEVQAQVATEGTAFLKNPGFSNLSSLKFTRDVFRETLRLYPSVPMMVRETTKPESLRARTAKTGAQIVISPWHVQRHAEMWDNPDAFDPQRFSTENGKQCLRDAFLPFSSGPRVCIGAGFAMIEGPLLLALMVAKFTFAPDGPPPVPAAFLTLRSRDGIRLKIAHRLS